VLVLLGFIATDFIITITLSASDAAVHLAENPLVDGLLGDQKLLITLLLVAVLGAVFLKASGRRSTSRSSSSVPT
jgi:hypothetical protein